MDDGEDPMAVAIRRRRFTVEEYHLMGEAGILHEDDQVELIDGEIVEMTPIGFRHVRCVTFLTALFVRALGDRAVVLTQQPLRLGSRSEFQPDIVLVRPPLERIPTPPDALLVVEAADTSLDRDREIKLRRYAETGIREVWIVDLNGEAVEVCRRPSPGGYQSARRVGAGIVVSPEAFPDLEIPVADILGPR